MIDRMVKVPKNKIIERSDIALIAGEQYRIFRIQDKPERGVELLELQSVQVTIRKE